MTDVSDLQRRNFLFGRFAPGEAGESSPAMISPSCLAHRGVACMSCRDACPTGAVRFELALGGARPRILPESCTGCGDCALACPADAIRLPDMRAAS